MSTWSHCLLPSLPILISWDGSGTCSNGLEGQSASMTTLLLISRWSSAWDALHLNSLLLVLLRCCLGRSFSMPFCGSSRAEIHLVQQIVTLSRVSCRPLLHSLYHPWNPRPSKESQFSV